MSAKFGPAGNADAFPYKSSVEAPKWLREIGLDCYEYQCGKGVHVGQDTACKLGQAAQEAGITLFVVSNSRKSRRCPDFCEALGIPYVRHAGKPGTRGFRAALEQTGIPAEQAIMVGDQIFTDTLGANRAGITSVLVRPMAWGKNPGRRLRYAIETPFRLLGMARHGRGKDVTP